MPLTPKLEEKKLACHIKLSFTLTTMCQTYFRNFDWILKKPFQAIPSLNLTPEYTYSNRF